MSIATLVPDHQYTPMVHPNGTRWAACSCGLELKQETPEHDHLRHILAIVWQKGADALADSFWDGQAGQAANPYTEDA